MSETLSRPMAALDRAKSLAGLISEDALASGTVGPANRPGRERPPGRRSVLGPAAARLHGGLGGSRRTFFEVVEEIARADGSAGWCASVCNAINHSAFRGLPEEGRRELFGDGPATCWAALAPNGVSIAEPGGFRVSTKGAFGSGSSLARWVLIAAPIPPGEGGARFRAHYVPKSQVRIDEAAWDVMGLRGTASIDYTADDVFVPAHLTYEYAYSSGRDAERPSAVELIQLNALGLSAFASGVAQHALAELVASAGKTKRIAGEGFQADDNVVQFGIGEIDGRMRAARALVLQVVSRMDERAARGQSFDAGIEAMQANQTLARASRDMAIFAFDNASTSVVYARHPLQRCLRDIFTGMKHASFTPTLLGRVGKVRLGLEYGGPPF